MSFLDNNSDSMPSKKDRELVAAKRIADSGADKDPVAAEQVAPIEIDPPVADLYPVPAYAKAGVSVDGPGRRTK